MPSCLAIFAHPDDVEYFAAGTMLQLAKRGWDLHYFDLCAGNGGSVQMDGPTTATVRLAEAQEAARILGAKFYPPVVNDMTLTFDIEVMRKVAAVIRQTRADIVLTHALSDYMEDHMACARLATSAAFTHGMPNYDTVPPATPYAHDVTIYHAMPHGLHDPLRRRVVAGAWVDTTAVHARKLEALACHESQHGWLQSSQGMNSYLREMERMSLEMGRRSRRFRHAEGWRRHAHMGLGPAGADPLREALGRRHRVNAAYARTLEHA